MEHLYPGFGIILHKPEPCWLKGQEPYASDVQFRIQEAEHFFILRLLAFEAGQHRFGFV